MMLDGLLSDQQNINGFSGSVETVNYAYYDDGKLKQTSAQTATRL